MDILRKIVALVLAFSICIALPVAANAADESEEEYIVLDTFYIPMTVTVYNDARSATTQVEIGANIQVRQIAKTTKIRTVIEVQSVDFWSGVQIESFSANIRYTNYTEFSIPDCLDSLYRSTTSPTNFLSGTKDSYTSFVTGHTIGVSVTITNVTLANAQWQSFTPGTYGARVTIR